MELLTRNAAYRRKKTNETLYLSSGARWGTNHSKSNNGKGNGRVALKTTGRNQNSRAGRPGACPARYCCRLSGHTSLAERSRGSPRLLRTALLPRPRTTRSILTTQYASSFHSRSSGEETAGVTVPQILWGVPPRHD